MACSPKPSFSAPGTGMAWCQQPPLVPLHRARETKQSLIENRNRVISSQSPAAIGTNTDRCFHAGQGPQKAISITRKKAGLGQNNK